MEEPLQASVVLGLDLGGTLTRAVCVDREGVVLGQGRGGSANLSSTAPASIGRHISEAVRAALATRSPAQVVRVVVGAAGYDRTRPEGPGERALRDALRGAGVPCEPDLRVDTDVAFAAGSPEPSGLVVISGTGAIAGRVHDRRTVRTVDGHGPVLGDRGSGNWIATRAVRDVLATLDRQEPLDRWQHELVEALDLEGGTTDPLAVAGAASGPSARLAALAPIVFRASRAGHAPSAATCDAAARALHANLDLLGLAPATTLVLGGGVLTHDTPVARRLIELVRDSASVVRAGPAELGAAWLALADTSPPRTWALLMADGAR